MLLNTDLHGQVLHFTFKKVIQIYSELITLLQFKKTEQKLNTSMK